MRRSKELVPAGGEDSMLDVIANLVGVLIILVAIAGACSRTILSSRRTAEEVESSLESAKQSLVEATEQSKSVFIDFQNAEQKSLNGAAATTQLESMRHQLLMAREVELARIDELAESKSMASESEAMKVELEIGSLKNRLVETRQKISARSIVSEQRHEQIVHYPTPIAKTVFSDEVHFRMSGGRIEFVPLYELIDQMKLRWKSTPGQIQIGSTISEQVGPIDGYRMDYRLNFRQENAPGGGVATMLELRQFEVHPELSDSGETVAEALGEGSRFYRRIQRLPAARTTISVWVYPDSYEQYNQLRDHLRSMGFQTAAWPLAADQPITGGPDGIRTTAQ